MSLLTRTTGFLCLLGLIAPWTASADPPATLPTVAEHTYRMLARVRPMLFWINCDNVGGAKVSLSGDQKDKDNFGIELLIGSDPQRAPRQINKWGYIAEEMRRGEA